MVTARNANGEEGAPGDAQKRAHLANFADGAGTWPGGDNSAHLAKLRDEAWAAVAPYFAALEAEREERAAIAKENRIERWVTASITAELYPEIRRVRQDAAYRSAAVRTAKAEARRADMVWIHEAFPYRLKAVRLDKPDSRGRRFGLAWVEHENPPVMQRDEFIIWAAANGRTYPLGRRTVEQDLRRFRDGAVDVLGRLLW